MSHKGGPLMPCRLYRYRDNIRGDRDGRRQHYITVLEKPIIETIRLSDGRGAPFPSADIVPPPSSVDSAAAAIEGGVVVAATSSIPDIP